MASGTMGQSASRALSAPAPRDKGLKTGALGLISTTVVAVASTAPAYSLAATLAYLVVLRPRAGEPA